MAYAAYLESPGLYLVKSPAPDRPQWLVMDVIVPSRDALSVRRALAPCPDAGIVRCVPGLDENRVRLEIRLAAHRVDDVMQRIESERTNKRARMYMRDLRRDAIIEYD